MKIDPAITLNQPGVINQSGTQANSGQDPSGQVNGRPASGTPADQKRDTGETTASSTHAPSSVPGVPAGAVGGLAVDDHQGVVVRFYDSIGKVVAQYPPEDYLEMMKEFNQVTQNLFHTTA